MTALMALLGEKAGETKGPRPSFLGHLLADSGEAALPC